MSRVPKQQNSSEILCHHFHFAVVETVHRNWSAILCQMSLLLSFKCLLRKGTSNKIFILTLGQFLLELFMNFENSGSLLHRKKNISKKFCNFEIENHLNGILFFQT